MRSAKSERPMVPRPPSYVRRRTSGASCLPGAAQRLHHHGQIERQSVSTSRRCSPPRSTPGRGSRGSCSCSCIEKIIIPDSLCFQRRDAYIRRNEHSLARHRPTLRRGRGRHAHHWGSGRRRQGPQTLVCCDGIGCDGFAWSTWCAISRPSPHRALALPRPTGAAACPPTGAVTSMTFLRSAGGARGDGRAGARVLGTRWRAGGARVPPPPPEHVQGWCSSAARTGCRSTPSTIPRR